MSHEDTWRADTRKIILAWVQSEEGRRALVNAAVDAHSGHAFFSEDTMIAALECSLGKNDD